jgi:hypothetical protein
MSRRGRSKDVAISLFSFQDIITSVTAIMILLVLILTLELITRTATKGMAAEDRRVARELKKSVADMEQQLEHLRREAAGAKEAASDAAGFSASETQRRQTDAEQKAKELEQEVARLELQLRNAQASRRTAEARLVSTQAAPPEAIKDRADSLTRHASQMEEVNKEERNRQTEEEKKAREGTSPATTLVFNAPPGNALSPLLVEVSKDGLVAVLEGGAATRKFGWGFLGPSTDFTTWLQSRDKQREYVVIILRPSGLEKYDATRQAVVTAGFEVGTELIGEEMSLVLGTR